MSDGDAVISPHKRAGALIDERRFVEAIEPATEACRLEPERAAAWWTLGVALKHGHRWAECIEACDRAIALDPDDCDGPRWNAGIAATALGNWPRARAAWTAYGIEIPDGDGPIEMKLGTAGVRVSPNGDPEVVYGKRLDPCRAWLLSVPLPESERRYGDIVLHDGEPRGKRRDGEREITVFDELMLLEPSTYGTWQLNATCRTSSERDAIVSLFDTVDGAIEDWTERLIVICRQCDLGERHDHHDAPKRETWKPERRFGLALRDERELKRLRQLGLWWRRGVHDVTRVL